MKTSVPNPRPYEHVMTLHGLVRTYCALSEEDRVRGKELRNLRCSLGFTLGGAAQRLSLSVVELSECEHGERRFDMTEAREALFSTE